MFGIGCSLPRVIFARSTSTNTIHVQAACRNNIISTKRTMMTMKTTKTTTESSLQILGLKGKESYNMKQIREAYLKAAKRCHPDLQQQQQHLHPSEQQQENQKNENTNNKSNSYNTKLGISIRSGSSSYDFLEVTNAYEYLKHNYYTKDDDETDIITETQEALFREACPEVLGLTAEQVEESKSNAAFRQWLQGNTDAAFHWRLFLSAHGGLAPMLRKNQLVIEAGQTLINRRRKRVKR